MAIPVGAILLFHLNVASSAWLLFAVASVLAVVGVSVAAVLFPKRLEYAWFHYQSGASAFAFGRSGPEAAKLEAFVGMLQDRIKQEDERRRLTTG